MQYVPCIDFECCGCEYCGYVPIPVHHEEKNIDPKRLYVSISYSEDVCEQTDRHKRHFSKFGEILSVKIYQKKAGRQKLFAFVTFKEAESASRALKFKGHFYGITVKGADIYWKHLAAIKKLDVNSSDQLSTNSQYLEEKNLEKNSILSLNDDCLLHIFSLLSLKKQLQISTLCKRFRSIFEMIFRRSKLLNNKNGNLTFAEVKQIITQVGHVIEEAHLDGYAYQNPSSNSRCLELVSHSCPNLRWLELTKLFALNIHPDTYRLISLSLKNLTKVELKRCRITDLVLNHLSHIPEIEYLDVSRNNELTGMYLASFPKLVHLNLNDCRCIEPKHFSELCKKRQLKSLNINRCYNLDNINFMEIESLLDNLDTVVISAPYKKTWDLLHIAGLKNLKHLTIWDCSECNEELLESLAKRKGNTLETLVLIGAVTERQKEYICSLQSLKKLGILRGSVNDDILLRKISSLPQLTSLILQDSRISRTSLTALFEKSNNLQYIDLSNCRQICAQAIFDIVEKIKESKRTSPCTLYVGNTLVPYCIVRDEKYLECAKLLPLSFEIYEIFLEIDSYRPCSPNDLSNYSCSPPTCSYKCLDIIMDSWYCPDDY